MNYRYTSQCKKCDASIKWFNDVLVSCEKCGTKHLFTELSYSMKNKNYYRKQKIKKIINNELFINKKVWKGFSDSELNEYITKLVNYYRKYGFPYFELSGDDIYKILTKMNNFDSSIILLEDKKLKQMMLGLNLVNYFMPHMWETKCYNYTTPMDCFNDDDMLKKAIYKRIKMGDNMSDAGMRKSLSWTSGTHRVSNFRPTIAKYIYDNYSGDGNVLDFSSGYGGRLLGAMSSKKVKKYTGIEPNNTTALGLSKIYKLKNHINNDFDAIIYNEPLEDVDINSEFDLSFSSPPYFNTEEYSYDDKQSFIRYPTKDEWKEKFLKVLIEKNYNWIKDNGYFIINVANVKTYPELEKDTIELATKNGFKLIKTYKMSLSSLMKSGFKYEPIFVFKKK